MTDYKEKAFDLVHCYTRYDRTDTEVLVDIMEDDEEAYLG